MLHPSRALSACRVGATQDVDAFESPRVSCRRDAKATKSGCNGSGRRGLVATNAKIYVFRCQPESRQIRGVISGHGRIELALPSSVQQNGEPTDEHRTLVGRRERADHARNQTKQLVLIHELFQMAAAALW